MVVIGRVGPRIAAEHDGSGSSVYRTHSASDLASAPRSDTSCALPLGSSARAKNVTNVVGSAAEVSTRGRSRA